MEDRLEDLKKFEEEGERIFRESERIVDALDKVLCKEAPSLEIAMVAFSRIFGQTLGVLIANKGLRTASKWIHLSVGACLYEMLGVISTIQRMIEEGESHGSSGEARH